MDFVSLHFWVWVISYKNDKREKGFLLILQANCTFKEIRFISLRFRGLFLLNHSWNQRQGLFFHKQRWSDGRLCSTNRNITILTSDGNFPPTQLPSPSPPLCPFQENPIRSYHHTFGNDSFYTNHSGSILVILTGIVRHHFWILSCPPKAQGWYCFFT